jgi:hypothetical protein
MSNASGKEFDLQPDPRVLPMLGEINIDQWRCIAELVDNSIDGFLHAIRSGGDVSAPKVDVVLPTSDKDGAQLRIIDNGLGMTAAVLEQAVRAGWSGNNPIDNLGLFGMGFNIATARLGSVTEVWTTRKGDQDWHGLTIDFDELRRQRHFRTPHLLRPKVDPDLHGTEVTIKRLKAEQRKWLSRSASHSMVKKRLAQAYSSMLRPNGVPLTFDLFINNKKIEPLRHCVWAEKRSVTYPDVGTVHAVMPINHTMSERGYCINCMNWVPETQETEPCPICSTSGSLRKRQRKVTGWIGIQRYKDQNDFGIDFVRNGRKIEISNKDLFVWRDGEKEEREYPIDDPRNEGRIVGEVHLDHCRVSYAKDRFDRADPSWDEMVQLIRGEGPLRPEKAKNLGAGPNYSPLFALFKAFRRTSPQSKTAGAYARIMIVKDNARAKEMATYFHDGLPDYQEDDKWWDLVEEADRELLYGGTPKPPAEPKEKPDSGGELPPGILGDPEDSGTPKKDPVQTPPSKPSPLRRPVPSLTRKYIHQKSGAPWNVQAFETAAGDPDLPNGLPWSFTMSDVATRQYQFLFDAGHAIFSSITMTPRDALLTQLAWMTGELLRTSKDNPELADILSQFRLSYGDDTSLDHRTMAGDAASILSDVARALVEACPQEERSSLFDELPSLDQQSVMRSLAARKIAPTAVTSDGAFLQYSPYEIVRTIVGKHPEYCFDGKIWDEPFESLDYGDKEITDATRASIVAKYTGLINDAIWLARQDTSDLASSPREELIRATMSLRLLRPDSEAQ